VEINAGRLLLAFADFDELLVPASGHGLHNALQRGRLAFEHGIRDAARI
jgi:hypothetical protein